LVSRREVADNVLGRPTASGHHRRAGADAEELAVSGVDDFQGFGALRIALVGNGEGCGVQTQARAGFRSVERGKNLRYGGVTSSTVNSPAMEAGMSCLREESGR
jgi:hypothetical protein